jgi:hypothetical protein
VRARHGHWALHVARQLVAGRTDLVVDEREGPTVYGQSPARRNTSAGCPDPIAESIPGALEVVRRRVKEGLWVVPGRRVVVGGSLGHVVGIREIEEGSLDLVVGIDVVQAGSLPLV